MKKNRNINNIQTDKIPKKKNIKKVTFAYLIGIIILIYFVYCIIQLIKQPTDIIAIEKGKLSQEESTTRICNKARNGCTRK